MRPWSRGPNPTPRGGPFCGPRRGYHHGNLKEALVEAARRFIAERGIGGFTLVDAARLVGVSPAALYRHFRGREALLDAVAGRGFAELAERLGRALRGPGTPIERFTRMGEAYLAFAEEEPGYYAAIFEPAGPGQRPDERLGERPDERAGGDARGRADAHLERRGAGRGDRDAHGLLVEALNAAFPAGLGGVDPRFVALEVWALAHGIATLSASGRMPAGPGFPGKYEVLRAGVLALVHGAASPRA